MSTQSEKLLHIYNQLVRNEREFKQYADSIMGQADRMQVEKIEQEQKFADEFRRNLTTNLNTIVVQFKKLFEEELEKVIAANKSNFAVFAQIQEHQNHIKNLLTEVKELENSAQKIRNKMQFVIDTNMQIDKNVVDKLEKIKSNLDKHQKAWNAKNQINFKNIVLTIIVTNIISSVAIIATTGYMYNYIP